MEDTKIVTVITVGGPSTGTRFRPLSLEFPKPLFPIAGVPMIYHHIAACSKYCKDFYLLGFYSKDLFENFIEETSKELGVHIHYFEETEELGTGGGLYRYRKEILSTSPDAILCLHSDICCSFPLDDLVKYHRSKEKEGCIGTLSATTVSKKDSVHYGCLVKNDNGELVHYVEKPTSYVCDTVNCGLYCFSPKMFQYIETRIAEKKRHLMKNQSLRHSVTELLAWRARARPSNINLERDVFVPLTKESTEKLAVFDMPGFWGSIKRAGDAVYSNDLYLKHYGDNLPLRMAKGDNIIGDVLIHPTAVVDYTAKIGPNVTIGPNAVVAAGVRIRDSVILDNVRIKPHACILHAIVGWDSIVGEWARVEGIPNDGPTMYVGDERKGIAILGRGTTTAPEVLVRNCIVMPNKTITRKTLNMIVL